MAVEGESNLAWRVGGPQGSGVDTAARLFAGACAAGGLHTFGRREYYSNIMGRHSYYDVRVSDRKMSCHRSLIHVLATFGAETLVRHAISTVAGGIIVYNRADEDVSLRSITFLEERLRDDLAAYLSERDLPASTAGVLEDARRRDIVAFELPYDDLTEKLAGSLVEKPRAVRTINTMAVAASCALVGYDRRYLVASLRKHFGEKPKIVDLNVRAVDLVYDYVEQQGIPSAFRYRLAPEPANGPMLVVGGSDAAALGKMAAGMTFQTYYPISPATDESVFLESHANVPLRGGGEAPIVIVQTEDELAAVTMATGAVLTGARAATATSGPGFSLMVEGLGWAGMNEAPLVVTLYQRGGPSTGLPTRIEQGDLLPSIYAGHGEFPRLVVASGDVEETFYDAAQVFNYAERYQTPVIHLLDQTLARTTQSLPPFDVGAIRIERGERYQPAPDVDPNAFYKRFEVTPSGITPRPFLGEPGGIHWLTGTEHTEHGQVTEDPVIREAQMEKRGRKLELAAREIPVEEKLRVYGDPSAEFTIVSWGSTKGAILEALEGLLANGISVRLIQVRLLWPFPAEELGELVRDARPLVVVEANYGAQFANLLSGQTCYKPDHLILKYNGRPMTCGELTRSLQSIHQGDAPERIVLRNPYE
ncbi:MAG TPA: 2-oxoacid:acceptor oxidoreductase subunit alpha [Anaerolineae bacterium]|nr:2-oxoacid:acceptor oxidoreductase subunit alpha [Anaerolineae bacterium]